MSDNDDCPELEVVPTEEERRVIVNQQAVHVHSSEEQEGLLQVDPYAEVIELNTLRIFSLQDEIMAIIAKKKKEIQKNKTTQKTGQDDEKNNEDENDEGETTENEIRFGENCIVLEFRKNLIHELIAFPEYMRQKIEVLDFFDNKIKRIGPFFSSGDSEIFKEAYAKYEERVQKSLDKIEANKDKDASKIPAEELVAYTNPLKGVKSCHWSSLRKLDLSYNQLKVIRGLDDLASTLEELYLVENQIKKVEGLDKLTKLKILELGGNQIRHIPMDSFHNLTELEQLWLGKNKLNDLSGNLFKNLNKLYRLSLQANRLTTLSEDTFPAGTLPELRELYLSENGFKHIQHIKHLKSLTLIDFSMNPIDNLFVPPQLAVSSSVAGSEAGEALQITSDNTEGQSQSAEAPVAAAVTELTLAHFPHLEEFWLTDGGLSSWQELEQVLRPFANSLQTVYLERNPLEKDRRYRDRVYQALPFVTQIDSWPVHNRGNLEGDRAIHR